MLEGLRAGTPEAVLGGMLRAAKAPHRSAFGAAAEEDLPSEDGHQLHNDQRTCRPAGTGRQALTTGLPTHPEGPING